METNETLGPAQEVCPVCSLNQENLAQHLETHSKGEIILALSNSSVFGRGNSNLLENVENNFQAEENQNYEAVDPLSIGSKDYESCSSGIPVKSYESTTLNNTSSIYGTSIVSKNDGTNTPAHTSGTFSTSVLGTSLVYSRSFSPFHSSLPLQPPVVNGIKDNASNINPTVLPNSLNSIRPATYIQSATPSGISQFASSIPVLYRPSSTPFQAPGGACNPPVMLQNSQLNLAAYKGYSNQNVIGAFGVNPLVNPTFSQKSETSNQVINQPDNLESVVSNIKPPSGPSISNLHTGHFSSNPTGSTQGQQVLYVVPFHQLQPSVPSATNYFVYGNSILPSNSIFPGIPALHQNGMNYIVAPQNSGLSANNSHLSNGIYYLPPNVPQFGVKQETATTSQTIPGNSWCASSENIIERSLSKISSSTQTNQHASKNFLKTKSENASEKNIQSNKNTVCPLPEKQEDSKDDDKVKIEIGSNIQISLPKDVIDKKDRLKELINRELVRGLLLNDSDNTSILQENSENQIESKKHQLSPQRKNTSKSSPKIFSEISSSYSGRNSRFDHKPVRTFTVACSTNNTGFITYDNLHSNSHMPITPPAGTLDNSHFKSDSEASDENVTYMTEKTLNNDLENLKSTIGELPVSSQITKNISERSHPSSSGIQSEVKFKNEGQPSDNFYDNVTSLSLLSLEKNFSFFGDAMFSDISYAEEQALEDVEEVFAGDNSINSESVDCKSNDISLANESAPYAFEAGNNSFKNNPPNSIDLEDVNPDEDELSSTPFSPMKYAKTYFRVKKSNRTPSIKASNESKVVVAGIASNSEINMKIQGIVEHTEEENIDDPGYDDNETNLNANIDHYSSVCCHKSVVREDDYMSEDSKELSSSLYQGVPLKIENGESNETHTEEVMSLKASETLADSDSERATPTDEVSEMYYEKNFIFAGEPGPANLSSQFPHGEDSGEHVSSEHTDNLSDFFTAPQPRTENGSDDAISLTLDANCSILPVDNLHFATLFNNSIPSGQEILSSQKEIWAKPTTKISKTGESTDDIKPLSFVTTGIIESQSSVSSHASTSGIQHIDLGSHKKILREEEEYDFEYESDCYGDSDSDIGYLHKGTVDLERWRCNKCNKTFKSLKEKLLHSGHHSPCSLGKTVADSQRSADEKALNDKEKDGKLSSPVSNKIKQRKKTGVDVAIPTSSEHPKSMWNLRIKRRELKKFKEEKETVASEDKWQVTQSIIKTDGEFKCPECALTFQTLDKLYTHRATAFKSRYICPMCHQEFKDRIGKLRHMKVHPLGHLKCPICYRTFESHYLWSQHQLFHMGLIAFECKECGHKCQRKTELEIHARKHSGERPFKCETCRSSFVSSHSLKRHLVTHLEGQETNCDICHKVYKNATALTKHKLKMHPKKKKFVKRRTDFMCYTCNEIFHSEKKLAWHQETHERWPKKCQQCGECFIHQSNLTKHIRVKHDPSYIPSGASKENVACTVCKKVYKRSSISLHMRTHTGVKPYKCNVCNKEFTVKCNYLSHKWVHTGVRDRPFKCKLCERSFHRKRFLEAHIRSHKKIRPYTCNECGKSFIHKSNYQTHIKLHTDEKQHQCRLCGKMFFRKYNLNNHIRIHTGETPFVCSICGKQFTQKSNFNVHMKASHVERHTIHEEV